ncbi:MAG: crotonase/enoyl-CoA hydratase family protein [Actinomycetota bacterium]|nr:crotonase/enoyl-CoA hydratase family protein [Acidimicrobiia bacterium]MDQ3147407.1 crotonase/enoyl-CoA hydratase family protein [Actinomycetota bacterium]
MTEPHLQVERDGHVVTVTMNRPERKNAFSTEMLVRLYDAWTMIDTDDEVRVAILTGAGGDFCSGADLKAMAAGYGTETTEWQDRMAADGDLHWKALLRHFRPRKPLIAAVEGYAVAGGTEILQATDIRIAGAGATFGIAEVRRGLFPLGGSTVRLRRQIAYTRAAELLLTGRHVSAPEALEMGLIGEVVPDGRAVERAREVAAIIAGNGPVAVQAVLASLRETEGMSEADGLARELELGWPVFATDDAKEGPRAFSEKRPPNFTGR